MKNIWKKHKIGFIVFGYGAFFASVAYFLIFPLIIEIREISDQIQKKIIDQQINESRLSQLSQMDEDWANLQAKRDSLEVVLDSSSELEFIKSMESIAEKTGNTIELVIEDGFNASEAEKIRRANSRKKNEEKGIMDKISYKDYFPTQITLTGSYENFINFIHMLENNHSYTNIIFLDIRKEIIKSEEKNPNENNPKMEELKPNSKEVVVSSINAIIYKKKQ